MVSGESRLFHAVQRQPGCKAHSDQFMQRSIAIAHPSILKGGDLVPCVASLLIGLLQMVRRHTCPIVWLNGRCCRVVVHRSTVRVQDGNGEHFC